MGKSQIITLNENKQAFSEPLLKIGEMLNIKKEYWISHEYINNLSFSLILQKEALESFDFAPILEALNFYKNSLTVKLECGSHPIYTSSKSLSKKDLKDLHAQILTLGPITISLEFSKEKWLDQHYEVLKNSHHLLLFIFSERLEYLFSEFSFIQLQEEIWGCSLNHPSSKEEEKQNLDNVLRKAVIFVPDENICLNGDYLLIIGGDYLNNLEDLTLRFTENPSIYKEILNRCYEDLKWIVSDKILISPWHFSMKKIKSELEHVNDLINKHFLALWFIFTADQTNLDESCAGINHYRAIYRSSNYRSEVKFYNPYKPQLVDNIKPEQLSSLKQILDYIYENIQTSSDKLVITQLEILNNLLGIEEDLREKNIIEKAKSIFENIKWQWKIFSEEKINENWGKIQTIETEIGAIINQFSDQLSDLTLKINETVFGAVAVILGSFISSIFGNSFNPMIFRIGVLTYSGYILIFPLFFSMSNRWKVFECTIWQFDSQKKEFKKVLPSKIVEKMIRGSMYKRNKDRFELWFRIAIVVYLLLVILLVVAAHTIPFMVQEPALAPDPTSVATQAAV